MNDKESMDIIKNAQLALRRLIDLTELAKSAKTKEEAEKFIKELELAHYQAMKCFSPESTIKELPVRKFIRIGQGDFKVLTELYTKLGAV